MKYAAMLILFLSACTTNGPGSKRVDSGDLGTNTTATGTGTGTGTATGTGTGTATGTGTGNSGTGTGGAGTDPCTVAIPPTAIVLSDTLVEPEDGNVYWVCRKGVLSLTGANNLVFVEQGGDLVINGTNNEAWLKHGAEAALFQSPNTLFYETENNINNQDGGAHDLTHCPTITWDLSNAPAGC